MRDDEPVVLTRRRLSIDSHAVDVRSSPRHDGRPVVMVHGIGVSGDYFLPFACVLARMREVHLLDLPGYGTTPKPPRPLSVPELADVAARSVARLGLVDPILVGQSMGCQVVVDAIASRPALAAAYILIGPTVDPDARSLVRLTARMARNVTRETAANNLVVLHDVGRMGLMRFLRTSRFMLADRIEENIAGCTVPGMVVRGARDPIAPAGWVRRLAALAPEAAFAEVPGAAHNVQYTHPDELATTCAPFLSRFATA
ncbi:MAG: alpha/beta hydrolase [Actinobacteria bacterium]|nr:alpha/beta hydrolase [Actinomycetota bacterium]